MLKVFSNGIDITDKVEYNSIKLSKQANNRRDTLSFTSFARVDESVEISLYKGSLIMGGGISAGAVSITAESIDHIRKNFFRVGDVVVLDPLGATEEIVEITSVSGVSIGITASKYSHVEGIFFGKKIFGGVTMKTPKKEIAMSEVMVYSVSAVDYSKIFDQESITDTYVNQYPREIIGRVVYKSTADDATYDITDAESLTGWSVSGVARTPTLNTTNKIFKNNSINGGATGAGAGAMKYTFSSSNFSAFDKVRFWLYMADNIGNYFSAMKFRLGNGASYYEWDAGIFSKIWSYESGKISEARIVGTPSLASITFFEFVFTSTANSPIGTIGIDHIFMGKKGFTMRGVERGNVLQEDLRSQFKKPASFVESIAKTNGFYWYIDSDRDIQFFANNARRSPFDLSDTSTNFGSLSVTADITNLKNRQAIRGGSAPSEFLYIQEKIVDGIETSYRLDYKPKTLSIYVDTGSGYVLKSSGIENLVAENTVDFVFNYNEKTVRNASIATLPANAKIKFTYYPYKDIRVVYQDLISINRMKGLLGGRGIFDGDVINDESIRTYADARARARAEVDTYKNPILTANFITEENGLEVGQVIHIVDPIYDIDDDFVIQKLSMKTKGIDGSFHYTVEAGTSLFGLIEFFQLLLKRSSKEAVDVSELIDIIYPVDETLIITDTVTHRKKTRPYFAHSRSGQYDHTLTLTEGGTSLDAYAGFCEAG